MLSHRSLNRSSRAGSATSTQLDQEEYRNYVLELVHNAPKSPRFQQLQSYYTALDRALKLEKKSASTEVHKLRSDEVVDFETWRKLRGREKAGEELDGILKDLVRTLLFNQIINLNINHMPV